MEVELGGGLGSRIVSMVAGILGGLLALFFFLNIPAYSMDSEGVRTQLVSPLAGVLLLVGMALALVAVVGAVLVLWRPRLAAMLILASTLVIAIADASQLVGGGPLSVGLWTGLFLLPLGLLAVSVVVARRADRPPASV